MIPPFYGREVVLDLLLDPYCFWKFSVPGILSGLTLTTAMFLVFKSPCVKFNWCIARSCARTWIPTVGITSRSASFRRSSRLPWKRCSTKKRGAPGSPAKSPMKSGKVSKPCSAFKTIASCSSSCLSLSFATKSRRPVMVSVTSKTWLLCPFPSAWPKTKRPASAGRISWGWTWSAPLLEQHSETANSLKPGKSGPQKPKTSKPLHQNHRATIQRTTSWRKAGQSPDISYISRVGRAHRSATSSASVWPLPSNANVSLSGCNAPGGQGPTSDGTLWTWWVETGAARIQSPYLTSTMHRFDLFVMWTAHR